MSIPVDDDKQWRASAASQQRAPSAIERVMRQRLLSVMAGLRDCRLSIRDAAGEVVLGTPAANPAGTLIVAIQVHDPAFYRIAALNGSVGAGEAYMDGLWDCD